jgi:hypothetical protein
MAHRPRWLIVLGAAVFPFGIAQQVAWAQDARVPAAPQTAPAQTPAASASSSSEPGKSKYRHAHDFLIRGTVFTEKSMSFPGVQLRIRRTGEKKFRWEDRTNSRGEFAMRVPQGSEYEMVAHAKGFADQARTIDARSGISENNVVFRMEPPAGGKK